MNFEFSDDQKLLKDQVRRFLEHNCASSDVREVLDSDDPFNKSLWDGIKDLGIIGTAIPEQYGGTGAGYLELCVVAEELGRAVAPTPFSSSVYLAAEALLRAGTEEQKNLHLPLLASGEKIGTLAVQEGVGEIAPSNIAVSAKDGKLTGQKIAVPDGLVADIAVVAAKSGSGAEAASISLFIVDLTDASVSRETLETVDPTRNLATLTFKDTPAEPLGNTGQGWTILEDVYDRAAILFAFEQLGGAQKALENAVDYAKERYAFGRPIGSFQALKHMMADMYVSTELARSNCYYGAWALSSDAAELPEAAATARVAATKAYQHCSKNNIQVHGGMGFTWEFDCHLHYRRSNLLALIIGSQSQWEDMLIDRLEKRNAA